MAEAVADIGLEIAGEIYGGTGHQRIGEAPIAFALVLDRRVAVARIRDVATRVAQRSPLYPGATDTGTDIGREGAVGPEVHIGIGEQAPGGHRCDIVRDAIDGNPATAAGRTVEVGLAEVVERDVGAQIAVDLVSDTAPRT